MSAEHGATSKRVYKALGEALCHSQTRARQAEKVASQALYDKEKIINILFREAWVSHTYKQWVKTLEFENMWLKMCSQSHSSTWMKKKFRHPYDDEVSNNPNNRRNQEKKNKYRRTSDGFLGYTIGIAFALGLSFASTGLLIGWSMGWILLAY